jgi:hypothetical protein
LFLCLITKPPRHEDVRRYNSTIFYTATKWRLMISFTTRSLCLPWKYPPTTHQIGGWVGPRANLDVGERRNISCPNREYNFGHPARSQSLYRLSYPGSYCTKDERKGRRDWRTEGKERPQRGESESYTGPQSTRAHVGNQRDGG